MGSGVGFDVKRTEAGVLFSPAFSCEFEAVSVVDQAVENGVGEGRICDRLVPVLDGQLAGDDGGAAAVTILEDFEKVAPLRSGERGKPQSSRMSRSIRPRVFIWRA